MKLRRKIAAALAALCFLAVVAIPAAAQLSKAAMIAQIASCFPDTDNGQSGYIAASTVRGCLGSVVNSYQQYLGVPRVVAGGDG